MTEAALLGGKLLICLAVALALPSASLARESCPVIQPLLQLRGVDFYDDERGSVVNGVHEEQNLQLQQELTDLFGRRQIVWTTIVLVGFASRTRGDQRPGYPIRLGQLTHCTQRQSFGRKVSKALKGFPASC